MLRFSLEAGTFEESFFMRPAKGEPDSLLRMAKKALDAGRRLRAAARAGSKVLNKEERAIAAMTAAAVRVFEELCMLARLNNGRVYPSYDWLAESAALGRATVARCLNILERAGFLVRQRRFKKAAAEGGSPRYEQTSNAYRPLVPTAIMSLLPRWMRPAPAPEDAIQRENDRLEDRAAMLARMSAADRARATIDDGPLGKALARLALAIETRECES